MALKRYVHSVVLAQEGVREDVDSWVAAGGKGVELADVEIDRLGRFRKRWGVQTFTNDVMTPPGPLAASLDYSLNLSSVQGELLSYTGKALYGYSTEATKWSHRGEFGSVMTERVAAIRDTAGRIAAGDVCLKGGYIVAGYCKKTAALAQSEPFVTVYDDSGTVVVNETRISTATEAGEDGMVMLECGTDTVGMVWREAGNDIKYTYTTTASEFASWTTVLLEPSCANVFDAVSMGASGFAYAFYEVAGGGNMRIRVADETGAQLLTDTITQSSSIYAVGLHWDGTDIHMVYHGGGNINYRRYNAALVLQASGVVKTTAPYSGYAPRCVVAYNGDTGRALVAWHESQNTSASVAGVYPTMVRYREVTASTGVVYGAESKTFGHYIISRIVVEDGKYNLVLSSDLHINARGYGYPYPALLHPGLSYDGLFMVRIEPLLMTEANATPLTVGIFALGEGFGNDGIFQGCAQNLASGGNGVYYSFMGVVASEFQAVPDASFSYKGPFQGNIYRHTRDSRGAGKMLPHHGGAVVLGGVPSFYDGVSAYNLATVVRPVILQVEGAAGGSLTASGTYGVLLVEEFMDAHGNIVLSQASDAVSITIGGGHGKINVGYRSSTIENKRDSFPIMDSAYTQRRMSFYRTEDDGTTYYYETSVALNKYATDWGTQVIDDADTTARERAQPYIYGGELSNNPLPSCHVGCVSSGRVHARSDENKRKVFYSKPSIPGRTVEFDLVQSYNMFPEDIVGMADMNGSPVAVSKGHVYVVDGLGPGLAGLPANAFSVREVAAVGTTDQESVIAVPGGVVFRGPDAFYLVGQGGLEPIGDKVQDAAGSYPTTLRSELDPQTRSARWLVTNDDGATRVLVYYWDSKQWVVHTPDISGGSLTSFCYHDGVFHFANDNGSYGLADGSAYIDGTPLLGGGGTYAGRVKLGWEHVEGIQGKKRFWEVDLLLRRRAAHALEVTLWYGRDESDSDVFYFSEGDITAMGSLEKVRVQVPHGRGVTDAIQVQVRDVEQTTAIPEHVGPFIPEYLPGSTQGFELVAVDYIVGIDSGAVKLSAARTA